MKFKFNEFGVCMNPDVVVEIQIGEYKHTLRIAVCSYEGKWDWSYSIHLSACGASAPCSKTQCRFVSKDEAIEKAIEYVDGYLENNLNEKNSKEAQLLNEWNSWKGSRNQLSLF